MEVRMSEIIRGESAIRDVAVLQAACRRLGIREADVHGTNALVFLPNWGIAPRINLSSGEISYDIDYAGGDNLLQVDRLKQAYATEHMLATIRRQGKSAIETVAQDGTIVLMVAA
jgi:hypothetical protein